MSLRIGEIGVLEIVLKISPESLAKSIQENAILRNSAKLNLFASSIKNAKQDRINYRSNGRDAFIETNEGKLKFGVLKPDSDEVDGSSEIGPEVAYEFFIKLIGVAELL